MQQRRTHATFLLLCFALLATNAWALSVASALCFGDEKDAFRREECCRNKSEGLKCWDTFFVPDTCCGSFDCWAGDLSQAQCCGPIESTSQKCLDHLRHALRRAICCTDYDVMIGDHGIWQKPNEGEIADATSFRANGFVGDFVLSIEEAWHRSKIRNGPEMPFSGIFISNVLAPHMDIFYSYARQCQSIVEMGVRHATSTVAWIRGLRDNGSHLKVLRLLDTVPRHGAIANRLRLAKAAGVDADFVESDSLSYNILEPADLLFVDTLHVYGQLLRELEKHAPAVRHWILVHDTELYGRQGECVEEGVDSAGCRRLDFEDWEFREGLNAAVENFLRGTEGNRWKMKARLNVGTGLTILERSSV